MNTLVVYDSQFGNTERIAQAIAGTLRSFGQAQAIRVDPAHPVELEGVDLLILGCPLDARTNLGSITTAVPGMTITSRTEHEVQGEIGSPPCASMTLRSGISSVNVYAELDGYVPHWEEHQEVYHRARKTVRAAVFGGLAGGIFFFGLASAILSGHFWPVFLAALAIAWLIGLLSSSKAQAMYVGFQGFVFFLGLAVCSVVGWWPWILFMLGISAILEIANGLLQPGDKERWWW